MADQGYQSQNLILKDRGVIARFATDAPPGESFYLNAQNLESIEENGLATRLGTTIVNKTGTTANPLSGSVHSIFKLAGLFGNQYRYASSGGNLYRRSSLTPGSYTLISNLLNGTPWTAVAYNPDVSSYPYAYFADMNGVIKDNGTLAAPQNAGILQPHTPVQAQAQEPDLIILDNFTTTVGYVYAGISPGILIPAVSNSTTTGVSTGVNEVDVILIQQIGLFQLLTIDTGLNQEVVLVLGVTATGFIANFTKAHLAGASVSSQALDLTVPAATTGSVSRSFGGTPIAAWPTKLEQEDYIGIYIYASDPTQIQSITLKFDCGDGSFQSDFFWRTISQGPLQPFLDTSTDSSTAAADAVLSQSLGVFSNAAGGVSGLNTGQGQWTPILLQLSDFSSTGRAAFDSPNFNWQTVNGYQVEITTGSNGVGAQVQLAALVIFGGAGPDSFAGVAYDYMFTFFNINDYTESNPSMAMTNVDPPLNTNWVLPRRQPVKLSLVNNLVNLDQQITHVRIYRRGGTLADNYRRIDQIPWVNAPGNIQTYIDILSDLDIQQADTISFTNDVPVTSTLPVPVNTTLSAPITVENQITAVIPVSLANISVNQQVSIGNVTDANFETVIVNGINIGLGQFGAFVQNTHAAGEPVTATAAYGQPVGIVAVAFDQGWYAEDPNNPSYLYYTPKGAIQYVSSAAFVPVSVPSDAITAIVPTSGNLFVSTQIRWFSVAPGSNATASPIIYPTRADRGCVGKNAWCLRDGVVYFLGTDGPRVFVGGETKLISEIIQFVWQGIGPTPLPVADPAQFANARVSYWNQFIVYAFSALDGNRYELVLDVEQKRWRNTTIDAQSLFLEEDTNLLVFGDSGGMIHLDRQNVAHDEMNVAGFIAQSPIAIDLETPYNNGNEPALQKQYQEFTLDANTNGNDVTCVLNFNDGEFAEVLGPINTTERQRINLNLNNGEGFSAYKVALELTGSGLDRIFLYQAKLKSLALAMTRQSLDTFWCRFSDDGSKVAKQIFVEYTASSPITGNVYYDGNSAPGFTFTLPQYNGVRNSLRVRLPAVKFRLARLILTSPSGDDFQVWNESRWEVKPLCQGKGYAFFPLMT